MAHISDTGSCVDFGDLSFGDSLTIGARYNTSSHPLNKNMNGRGNSPIMGISQVCYRDLREILGLFVLMFVSGVYWLSTGSCSLLCLLNIWLVDRPSLFEYDLYESCAPENIGSSAMWNLAGLIPSVDSFLSRFISVWFTNRVVDF